MSDEDLPQFIVATVKFGGPLVLVKGSLKATANKEILDKSVQQFGEGMTYSC